MSQSDSVLEVHVQSPKRGSGSFALDIAFRVPPGVTVLFGPSGSGKSTTLAAISGLLLPAAGRIALGPELWFDSASAFQRPVHTRGVSCVSQPLALFPHLTGCANVMFGIDQSLPRALRRAQAMRMLRRMKVAHLAARRPSTFSAGEAQRVALARAFARGPRVVLLDEAFSALDANLRRDLNRDVRAMIARLGIPAVLVTHDQQEARAMGDRLVVLEAGRVVAQGTLDAIWPPAPSRHAQLGTPRSPHLALVATRRPGTRSTS